MYTNIDISPDFPYPMPRPMPGFDFAQRTNKRMIHRPGFRPDNTFYDSTKPFRDSRVIYLSDYDIFQECRRSFVMPIYFGNFLWKLELHKLIILYEIYLKNKSYAKSVYK